MPARRIAFAIVAGLAVLAAPTATKAAETPTASAAALGTPRVVASGLNVPWGVAFLLSALLTSDGAPSAARGEALAKVGSELRAALRVHIRRPARSAAS